MRQQYAVTVQVAITTPPLLLSHHRRQSPRPINLSLSAMSHLRLRHTVEKKALPPFTCTLQVRNRCHPRDEGRRKKKPLPITCMRQARNHYHHKGEGHKLQPTTRIMFLLFPFPPIWEMIVPTLLDVGISALTLRRIHLCLPQTLCLGKCLIGRRIEIILVGPRRRVLQGGILPERFGINDWIESNVIVIALCICMASTYILYSSITIFGLCFAICGCTVVTTVGFQPHNYH